jgi:hypothetical protein
MLRNHLSFNSKENINLKLIWVWNILTIGFYLRRTNIETITMNNVKTCSTCNLHCGGTKYIVFWVSEKRATFNKQADTDMAQ